MTTQSVENVEKDDFLQQKEIIKKIISSISKKSLTSTIDKRLTKLSPLEFLYAYTGMSQKTNLTSRYRKLLIDFFQSLESAFPGSAYIAAHMICDEDQNFNPQIDRIGSESIFEEIEKYMSKQETSVVRAIIESGGGYRSSYFDSPNHFGNFIIRAKKSESITLASTSDFSGCNINFASDSLILFCDMVFEKMSELDNLVRWAQKENKYVCLVSRGFLPEVSSTLFYNYTLGKTKVFPVVIEYSDADPFNLDDISSMCGCKVVHGPLSIFSDESWPDILSPLYSASINKGSVVVKPKGGDFNLGDLKLENLCKDRLRRVLSGEIRVSMPASLSIIQKSRIKKGVHIYRGFARAGRVRIDNVDITAHLNAYNKILKSVEVFKKTFASVEICIKV